MIELGTNSFDDDLYYKEVSLAYVWKNDLQTWQKQDRFYKSSLTLNRLNMVNIADTEKYYLRLLLYHVPNPTSFDALRTYKNKLYDNFQ